MSVTVGPVCAGCIEQKRSMLLFEITRGHRVCETCFGKAWPYLIEDAREEMKESFPAQVTGNNGESSAPLTAGNDRS